MTSVKLRFLKEFYEIQALCQDHQDSIYFKNTPWSLYWHNTRMLKVMRLLLQSSGRFLEVGCAEGLYIRFYSETHQNNQTVVGLDISSNYIKKAKKRDHTHTTMWVVGDVHHLPFRKGIFDIVLCSEVLEHLPHPKIGFSEVCHVSRKRILITVPGEDTFLYIARKLKLLNFLKRLNLHEDIDELADPRGCSGHISKIKRKDLIEWSNDEELNALLLQTTCYFSREIAGWLRLPAFFIRLATALDPIFSKIPYISKNGLLNVLFVEHKHPPEESVKKCKN